MLQSQRVRHNLAIEQKQEIFIDSNVVYFAMLENLYSNFIQQLISGIRAVLFSR